MSQPASPESSRARRTRHARSSAVLSSTSSLIGQQLPATTTIPPSTTSSYAALQPLSNPLLQPDVTPSDLFSRYTPNEISSHLLAIKSQLQTYDAELRALINTRYEDILSVGNTITAMKGSSDHLSDALSNVGRGMKAGQGQQGSDRSGIQQEDSEEAKRDRSDQQRTKHIASLLLIIQEGPEEIWRILDSVTQSAEHLRPVADPSANSHILSRAKSNLRAARKLASATALFEAVRLAGQELNSIDDARRLFSHHLQQHASTLNALRQELKSSLEASLVASSGSTSFSSSASTSHERLKMGTQRVALEGAARGTTITLLSLVVIGAIPLDEVVSHLLEVRRKQIEDWLQSQVSDSTSRRLFSVFLEEIAEASILVHRVFGEGSPASNFHALLQHDSSAQSREGTSSSQQSSLQPVTAVVSLQALPSSSRICDSLSSDSLVLTQSWTTAVFSKANEENVSQHLQDWSASLLRQLQSQHSKEALDSLKSTRMVGRARWQLQKAAGRAHKLVAALQKRQDLSTASSQALAELFQDSIMPTIDDLLRQRAAEVWIESIKGWSQEVIKLIDEQLSLIDASGAGGYSERSLFGDLSSPIAAQRSARRPLASDQTVFALQSLLDGCAGSLASVLDPLSRGWKILQAAKADYFDYVETEESPAVDQERLAWLAEEGRTGWQAVTMALTSALSKESSSEQQRHGHEKILFLCQLIDRILTLPRYTSLLRSSYTQSKNDYDQLLGQLSQSRDKALQSWIDSVVAQAGALWFESRSDIAEEQKADGTTRPASAQLIRALWTLNEAANRIATTSSTSTQVGSMSHLLQTMLSWSAAQLVEEDGNADKERLLGDLDVLEALVHYQSKDPSQEQKKANGSQSAPEQILTRLRAALSSASNKQDKGQSEYEALLSRALSPYALLLGQVATMVPLPSQSKSENGYAFSGGSSLFPLAGDGQQTSIRGVEGVKM